MHKHHVSESASFLNLLDTIAYTGIVGSQLFETHLSHWFCDLDLYCLQSQICSSVCRWKKMIICGFENSMVFNSVLKNNQNNNKDKKLFLFAVGVFYIVILDEELNLLVF